TTCKLTSIRREGRSCDNNRLIRTVHGRVDAVHSPDYADIDLPVRRVPLALDEIAGLQPQLIPMNRYYIFASIARSLGQAHLIALRPEDFRDYFFELPR